MASGFKEIRHTADWALLVWAPDLEELLRQAAAGMNWLMGVVTARGERITRSISLTALDAESLTVAFLNEILFIMESEAIGFDDFRLTIEQFTLTGQLTGGRLTERHKAIKAVTYNNLEIIQILHGLETTIVFDV